jgi:hypothetical protein
MVLYAYVLCLRILTSPRIPDTILGDEPLISEVVLSHYSLHIILFLHLLSTNHKCTQPYYFPLLYKPAAQKVKMDWNSLTMSARLCVAPVAVPVVLWSLPLSYFARELLSL